MHRKILSENQLTLLPLIKAFSDDYYLVGGTAIALILGHRRSIDFDLFTFKNIKRRSIKRIIQNFNYSTKDIVYEAFDQLHIVINSVKITFFNYPYKIVPTINFSDVIKIPSLLDLSAMKAYALGGRAKWKDYVDLYFVLKDHFTLSEISIRAKEMFKEFFNEKLFREELGYFNDIDYSEQIEYIGKKVSDKKIKEFLIHTSLKPF